MPQGMEGPPAGFRPRRGGDSEKVLRQQGGGRGAKPGEERLCRPLRGQPGGGGCPAPLPDPGRGCGGGGGLPHDLCLGLR